MRGAAHGSGCRGAGGVLEVCVQAGQTVRLLPGTEDDGHEVQGDGRQGYQVDEVLYSGVDQVGDAVCSDIVGAQNANVKHTKNYFFHVVGPFEPGKQYGRWASGSFTYPMKVTAFPREIYIDYMDRSPSDTIVITRDNIGQYFPKVAWMDVDYEHGFQPSN